MENHNSSSRNTLAREGGPVSPSPGRAPAGARKKQRKPAASSIPSDWYPEKSSAAATNERKRTKHSANVARGQRFRISRIDASMPSQHSAPRAWEPFASQASVGAYQKRAA